MEGRIIPVLEDAAARIQDLESRAGERLHQDNDPERYHELMREKARVLADLPAVAEPVLQSEDPVLSERVAARLARFSQSANQALDLDSVFYMSALLYPEDHREGDPNDLDFIGRLQSGDS
jgi:hypothetical protein